MTRRLLTAAAAMVAISAMAAPQPARLGRELNQRNKRVPMGSVVFNTKDAKQAAPTMFHAPEADATLSMNWGYCEEIYSAMPMNEGTLKGAIILSKELSEEFAGAKLTSISIATPADANTQSIDYENWVYTYDNPIKKATVWLAEDLESEPFASVEAELGPKGFTWQAIELPEAYVIEKGKQVVIGYTMDIPENNGNICPVIADFSSEFYKKLSCWVYTNLLGMNENYELIFEGDKKWKDFSSDFGNLCIRAGLEGDNLPTNKCEIVDYLMPQYVAPGEDLTFMSIIRNTAANDITSIEYTLKIDGMEPQTSTVTMPEAVPYFEYSDILSNTFKCTTVGNNVAYEIGITAINGEKLDEALAVQTGLLLCIAEGYPKNNVIEEATGTWCGWCVVGYAGMEYMAENYADQGFIGIAVHGGDQMDVMGEGMAYETFGNYVEGFPSAYLNRDMTYSLYPSPEDLADEFEYVKDIPAYAKISATISENGGDGLQYKLSTSTEFSGTEENANYMVAYTVMEDDLGPYTQENYCAGTGQDYYGFEDKPAKVRLKFNDVARNCSRPMGIANSLPTSIEKGKAYEYNADLVLDDVKDTNNVRVVAMVINGLTGAIENAVSVKTPYNSVEAVEDANSAKAYGAEGAIIISGNADHADVYAIDGRHVASNVKKEVRGLSAGIYVVVLDGKSVKVCVK